MNASGPIEHGQRHGSLLVVKKAGAGRWFVRCDCGHVAELLEKSVRLFACPACARAEKLRPGRLPFADVESLRAWLLAPFNPHAALLAPDAEVA